MTKSDNSSSDKMIQKRKSCEAKKAKITAVSSSGSSTKYCKGVYCIMNLSEKPNEEFDWTSKAQKSRKSKCRLCIREERRMKRHQ